MSILTGQAKIKIGGNKLTITPILNAVTHDAPFSAAPIYQTFCDHKQDSN